MSDPTRIFQCALGAGVSPRSMGDLETALEITFEEADLEGNDFGLFASRQELFGDGNATSLSVTYEWDMYHEAPVSTLSRLRSRRVRDFAVGFARGRVEIEEALRRLHGPPRTVAGKRAYDRWFVAAEGGQSDGCTLWHYGAMPDWAIAAPDGAVRERFLRELVAAVATAETLDAVYLAASPPPISGVVLGERRERHVQLEMSPPIAAMELARILGWSGAIGLSTDVHQSSWRIWWTTGVDEKGPTAAAPNYGRWNVVASLEGRPTGGDVAGHRGPFPRQQLGAADLVRHVRIESEG